MLTCVLRHRWEWRPRLPVRKGRHLRRPVPVSSLPLRCLRPCRLLQWQSHPLTPAGSAGHGRKRPRASKKTTGLLLALTACLLFVLFLRSLAQYLEADAIIEQVQELLTYWVVLVVSFPGVLLGAQWLVSVTGLWLGRALLIVLILGWEIAYRRLLYQLLYHISYLRQQIVTHEEL